MNKAAIINQLPAMDAFPSSAPRYPNLWVLVEHSLTEKIKPYSRFRQHRKAFELVWECLQLTADLQDDYAVFHSAEGCDGVGRRRGLQYIELGNESHDHSLHVRFYNQAVQGLQIAYEDKLYFAVAASVHYEVDRPGKHHPYIDQCPVCGCTGEYRHLYEAEYHNRSSARKNIYGHDPLGIEAVLLGSAQGKPIPLMHGLDSLDKYFDMDLTVAEKPLLKGDMVTGNLGLVMLNGLKP